MMELSDVVLKKIEESIRKYGVLLRNVHADENNIYQKEGLANFVTEYDIQIQKGLMEDLSRILPGTEFFGEEDTAGNDHGEKMDGYCFFIDPIDGTTNFLFNYRHSCISVGLSWKKEIVAGFVYNPYTDVMYKGIRGQGAYANDKSIHVLDCELKDSLVAFGCARYNEGDTDLLFASVKEIYLRCLGVRNGGSAALDCCRSAEGSNGAYVELKLQPYDYAAASVIIEEAGGVITQIDGKAITLDAPCSILAGSKQICREIQDIIQAVSEKLDKNR